MYDLDDYRRAIHRNNVAPEQYRIGRHYFGVGLAIFWLAYLAAMAYGLLRLYDYIAGALRVG